MSTIRLRRRIRRHTGLVAFLAILCTSLLNPSSALAALEATAPLTQNNGILACPTCATEAAPTQYGLPVWSTTQELGVVGPDASTTKALFSAGSSANPAFRSIAIGDIPADTATNWAAKIGTPTGTGEFVRAGAPTVTGNWVLPADFIDTITEVAAAIKQGTGGTKFALTAGGLVTTGKQVQFDANGNLEATATNIGGGAAVLTHMDFSPITSLTVTDATDIFCGFDGSCSATANGADVQTPFTGTGTFDSIDCRATSATGTAITVDLDFGTCGAALSTGTGQAVMSVTGWAAPTAQTGSSSFTTGQCGVFKLSTASADANKVIIRCSVKRTAGA